MLELKECCYVPCPEKLFEEYETTENAIYANVNTSKVLNMMSSFIDMHKEPLFFILELPCKENDDITRSKLLYNTSADCDVYFIDGLNETQAKQILDALGNFLIKDGMNTFGFGGHESHEEILFGRYNVITLYTKDAEKYYDFMSCFGIKKTEKLVTAWDTFSQEHPGECRLYVSKETGNTIYDIPEKYKPYGMYYYESRKSNNEAYEQNITLDDLIGKVLLVGVKYYTHDNEFIGQNQFYGIVTEANDDTIRIKQKDGSEFTLQPDLSSVKRARAGEYTLRSTGEMVINPDFLATWSLIKGEN